MDRFNHEIGISGGGDDTDDTDDLPLFGSFGSYSPQYRKHNSSLVQINHPQQYYDELKQQVSQGTISNKAKFSLLQHNTANKLIAFLLQQHRQVPPQHRSVVELIELNEPNEPNEPSEHDNRKKFSTPDSSQTDSDDVSPQIQRKRKSAHQRDILPRFSISIEDDHSGYAFFEFQKPYQFDCETKTTNSIRSGMTRNLHRPVYCTARRDFRPLTKIAHGRLSRALRHSDYRFSFQPVIAMSFFSNENALSDDLNQSCFQNKQRHRRQVKNRRPFRRRRPQLTPAVRLNDQVWRVSCCR